MVLRLQREDLFSCPESIAEDRACPLSWQSQLRGLNELCSGCSGLLLAAKANPQTQIISWDKKVLAVYLRGKSSGMSLCV